MTNSKLKTTKKAKIEEVDVDVDVEDEETVDENARTDAEEEGYLDGMHDEKEDLDEGALDKLKLSSTLIKNYFLKSLQ